MSETEVAAAQADLEECRNEIARLNLAFDDVLIREMLVRRISRKLTVAADRVQAARAALVGGLIAHDGMEADFLELADATTELVEQARALERAMKVNVQEEVARG